MRRTSLLGYGLAALLLVLLVPVPGALAEDVPWHAPVEPVDRGLLDRLLSADEAIREAAAKEWEEARLAALPDYGPNHWPPPPVDALSDDVDPLDAWGMRKKRMMKGLVVALQEGAAEQRVAAARSIRSLAPAYTSVIDVLAAALTDAPVSVRLEVLRTLAGITQFSGGRYVDTKLADVVARIEDEDAAVRAAALELLGRRIRYGHANDGLRRRVLDAALAASEDESPDVRVAALTAAVTMATPQDERLEAAVRRGLDDSSAAVRSKATDLIAWRPKGFDAALPRLRALLEDDAFDQRYAAARAIWSLSSDPTPLVPLLAEALERFEGLDLVGPARFATEIGPAAEVATPGLVHALGTVPHARHLATGREPYEALVSIGPSAGVALPAIEEELHRRGPADRAEVLRAVITVNAEPERLAAFVVRMLSTYAFPEPVAVEATVLHGLGIETPALLELAKERFTSKDPWERNNACHFLGTMRSPEAVALLVEKMQNPMTRVQAIIALMDVGEHAKAAVPALVRALATDASLAATALMRIEPEGRDDPKVVEALLEALKTARPEEMGEAVAICHAVCLYGGALEPCFESLLTALDDRNTMVRRQATEAFGCWGAKAEEALPRLRKLMAEGDTFYEGLAAATAIFQITGEHAPTLAHAMRATRSSHPRSWMAVHALRLLGPHAAEAVPLLIDAALAWRRAMHRQEDVMKEAVLALGAIGPAAVEALPVLRELEHNHLVREEARKAIEQIEKR